MTDENGHLGYARTMTPDAVAAQVRAKLSSLPPAAARVAQLILDDPDTVARSTLQQVVERVGTSEATIVRTARALGFDGYRGLRFALATAAGHGADRQVTGTITADSATQDVVDTLAFTEQQALRETAAHLSAAAVDAVATDVVAARKVAVYGLGASWLVASDLHQKMMRIGLVSNTPMDNHLAITDAVMLTSADVAIGVSHSGETVETVEFVEHARRNGARTVAITSAEGSTLARTADHVLFAAGRDEVFRPAAFSSRISHLLVVDCLFVAVVQRTYDRSSSAIQTTHEALIPKRGGQSYLSPRQ